MTPIERGLVKNPHTAPDILHKIAASVPGDTLHHGCPDFTEGSGSCKICHLQMLVNNISTSDKTLKMLKDYPHEHVSWAADDELSKRRHRRKWAKELGSENRRRVYNGRGSAI